MKPENLNDSRIALIRKRFLSGEIDKYEYSRQMHASHMSFYSYAEWLKSTQIAEIRIDKKGVFLVTEDGLHFWLDQEDQYVAPIQLLNFGDYEAPERELLFRIIKPGMTVFDIGANTGWYALILGKKMPESKVYAFEPLPPTFQKLVRNIRLNQLPNVTAFPHGLSDKEEEKTFYFSPDISGAASGANILGWETVRKEVCKVRRLDSVWKELEVCVDFIKCDVEGAELFVFQGGLQCVKKDKPIIFCEMLRKWSAKFGYHPDQMIDLLGTEGYQCYAVGPGRLEQLRKMEETTVATNFLFLHSEKHEAVKSSLMDQNVLVG